MGKWLCGGRSCCGHIIGNYGMVVVSSSANQDAGVSGYMAHNRAGNSAGYYRRFTDEIK